MPGTVTATRSPRTMPNAGKTADVVVVDWTSDASGDATGSITNLYGWLVKVVTDPSGVNTKEVQTVTFSATPTSGSFKLNYGGNATGALAHSDNAAAIQTALRLVAGLGSVTVSGSYAAGFVVTFEGVDGNAALMTVTDNSLDATGAVTVTVTETTAGSHLIPSDNYDMTLVDEDGLDALISLGLNRDTANNEDIYPLASGAKTPVFLCGTHTFTIANAGNAKVGRASFYLTESR